MEQQIEEHGIHTETTQQSKIQKDIQDQHNNTNKQSNTGTHKQAKEQSQDNDKTHTE